MNSLVHHYSPRGSSRALFSVRTGEVLLSGPAGTGKSRACLEKLHLMMLANSKAKGLIVRKTATSLTSSALRTWEDYVVPESVSAGHITYFGGSTREPAQYRYGNGSTVAVGGMDKATKIMSTEYDVVYVQEAIELTEDDWESITSRLRNGRISFQQLMADTNPTSDTHWLNVRCNTPNIKTGKITTMMLNSVHEENPILFDESGNVTERGAEYIAKLDNLTGVRYLRLRKGLWVGAEGQIYEDYDPAIHIVDSFDIPMSWQRYWTVDFGFSHPFVLQCWAEDPDGRLYLYREIFRTHRLVEDHAKDILDIVAPEVTANGVYLGRVWKEPKPRRILCDHDAEDRATLEKHLGLTTSAAKKTVSDGLQATASRWKRQADGKPRLFLCRNALVSRDKHLVDVKHPTCTAEEIPGYVWDANKDAPVKDQDDGCDAMRYMVADRDLRGDYNIRWV